ncbi:MAG: RecX family transcriptional regulator [Ardenticatenaceae bacterium]|nr:RecX family transcriptional regulator [Anaerolineales bacterium]MCB8921920.1 RecX family transcriptional regulator [Ardenticatenaceae bacterium]MCB8989495.1 RecX family transcriptional regulator [Ardenticatenaceae bacterium]
MGKITALTAQKRNTDRVNVFLDGEFAFGLAAETAVSLRLGQELSPSEIQQLQAQDDFVKAKESAVRLIGQRPRSVAEIRLRLQRKGYDELLVDRVVTRLQEVELLDDAAFTRYWVDQREAFKPRSQMALRQELMQKGISRETIEAALAQVDEVSSARKIAEQKAPQWHNLPEEDFRKKMAGFLQRRGFHYEIIREVTEQVWRESQ